MRSRVEYDKNGFLYQKTLILQQFCFGNAWGWRSREKKNPSGVISIQIIDKSSGRYQLKKTIGSARHPDEVERLLEEARSFIHPVDPAQPVLLPAVLTDDTAVEHFLDSVTNAHIHTCGPEAIFGTLFEQMGFSIVPQALFRHLVVARLAHPVSKLKTVDYLYRAQGVVTSEDAIYRFLDTLNEKHKTTVEQVAFNHTKETLGTISVVFYDMTTLYFEAQDEDDLRKIGFSKDGKFQCPQIMIGLLVGEGGYPIGYDVFEGNTFEGHTLIPTLEKIQKKYGFAKPVVVADAGLLSKDNVKKLQANNYQFILGARIKNETETMKQAILRARATMENGTMESIAKEDGTTLIVSWSDTRSRKDAHNREKGLAKLRLKVKSGILTKASVTNRGYNKFLTLGANVPVSLDEDKVKQDEQWDGLKGYVTNSTLPATQVLEHYGHLWQIEKAFRISKTDLRIRPIYHYKRRRIEAHLCIAFVAYSIWKELERLLKEAGIEMSPTRAAELTRTMYEITYTLPQSKRVKRRNLALDGEQQLLYGVVHRG